MSDTTTAGAESMVRPFRIEVPQGEIDELRRRVKATRWRARELVTDRSQGVPLAAVQNLARSLATAGTATSMLCSILAPALSHLTWSLLMLCYPHSVPGLRSAATSVRTTLTGVPISARRPLASKACSRTLPRGR